MRMNFACLYHLEFLRLHTFTNFPSIGDFYPDPTTLISFHLPLQCWAFRWCRTNGRLPPTIGTANIRLFVRDNETVSTYLTFDYGEVFFGEIESCRYFLAVRKTPGLSKSVPHPSQRVTPEEKLKNVETVSVQYRFYDRQIGIKTGEQSQFCGHVQYKCSLVDCECIKIAGIKWAGFFLRI